MAVLPPRRWRRSINRFFLAINVKMHFPNKRRGGGPFSAAMDTCGSFVHVYSSKFRFRRSETSFYIRSPPLIKDLPVGGEGEGKGEKISSAKPGQSLQGQLEASLGFYLTLQTFTGFCWRNPPKESL